MPKTHNHKVGDVWYRYQDYFHGDTHSIHLQEHIVTRVTSKCVFFDDYGHERRVLVNANKRWASPTIDEAKTSFKRRKSLQRWHLERQLEHVVATDEFFERMQGSSIYFSRDELSLDRRFKELSVYGV